MTEIYKKIVINKKEYEYYISNLGNVKNAKGHILKPYKRGQRKGTYLCVRLYRYKISIAIDIQRLVGFMFISNPENKPEVNHLDGDHFNNKADNLEWCTRSENERHKRFLMGCKEIEDAVDLNKENL